MKHLISMGLKCMDGKLWILDQTRLPHEETWIDCENPDQMFRLIQSLGVRGAPLIGVAAALSVGLFAEKGSGLEDVRLAALKLRSARPTAINLMHAMDRILLNLSKATQEAELIFEEDVRLSEILSERAARLIESGDSILTHCNTGGLVTAGIGTALGGIRRAHEQGKKIHVYVDETRPLLQGARLTTWELQKLGIPHTLICDSMAASLMAKKKINKVFVGADRIAKNGDVANKIGTYSAAVLARHHGIPFYVIAPHTTFDESCPSGEDIPIELRASEEVRNGKTPQATQVWNPAFDVTPRRLITEIVLDDERLGF